MIKKIIVLFLTFVIVLVAAVGCDSTTPGTNSAPADTSSASAGTNSTTPGTDGSAAKDTVNIAWANDVATFCMLNSASATDQYVFFNIYDCLMLDMNGKLEPKLAESWNVSDDGLTYTFNLRKGVKFTNGEAFKASDVIFTFEQALSSPYTAETLQYMEDIVAIDDYTVEMTLSMPYAPFLPLSVAQLPILNEKAWNDAGGTVEEYCQNPVGTGPYTLAKHDIGQDVVLERNDDYWGGKPVIKTATFQIITDPNTATVALQSGDVDLLNYAPTAVLDQLRNDAKLAVHDYNPTTLYNLTLNNSIAPFNDVRVRQAFNYALNRDDIITIADNGNGIKADSIVNSSWFGYSDKVKGYDYNVQKAKELLAAAGYADGLSVNLITTEGVLQKIAETVQGQLANVGVTAKIQVLEKNTYIKDVMSGNFEMGSTSWTLGADVDVWGQILKSTAGANFPRFADTEVDKLFEQGAEATDNAKRLEIYQQLLQIVNDRAPIVPLYFPKKQFISNKNLTIGEIDSAGFFYLTDMKWN